MGKEFDILLAAAALIVGIMLLTGHGDIFLKGGNTERRSQKYNEEKMTKGSGTALVLIGIATFIDAFTTSFVSSILYMVFLIIVVIGLVLYLKFKCQK